MEVEPAVLVHGPVKAHDASSSRHAGITRSGEPSIVPPDHAKPAISARDIVPCSARSRPVSPPIDITMAHVQSWLEDRGEPLNAASVARLRGNLRLLAGAGVTTVEQVHQWANARHVHDFRLACAVGPITQLGYLIGMELASNWLVGRLPRHVLADASQVGAVLGAFVGALDVGTTVLGEALMRHLSHAGSAAGMPQGVARRSMADNVLHNTFWATCINLAKNTARAILPFVQRRIEARPDGLITRQWSDLADVTWDGGVGLVAGLVDTARKMHHGSDGIPYLSRLLLQPPAEFTDLVNRTRPSGTQAIAHAQPHAEPATQHNGFVPSFPSIVVPLAVIGIIVVHISMLVSRNANVVQALHEGHDLPKGYADPSAMSVKSLSSIHQMALMTATINLLAPYLAVAAAKVADYAMDPKLPKAALLRWPSFLQPGLLPPPAGERMA